MKKKTEKLGKRPVLVMASSIAVRLENRSEKRRAWVLVQVLEPEPNLNGGKGWFINSQTRPLHASEEPETSRQGANSP